MPDDHQLAQAIRALDELIRQVQANFGPGQDDPSDYERIIGLTRIDMPHLSGAIRAGVWRTQEAMRADANALDYVHSRVYLAIQNVRSACIVALRDLALVIADSRGHVGRLSQDDVHSAGRSATGLREIGDLTRRTDKIQREAIDKIATIAREIEEWIAHLRAHTVRRNPVALARLQQDLRAALREKFGSGLQRGWETLMADPDQFMRFVLDSGLSPVVGDVHFDPSAMRAAAGILDRHHGRIGALVLELVGEEQEAIRVYSASAGTPDDRRTLVESLDGGNFYHKWGPTTKGALLELIEVARKRRIPVIAGDTGVAYYRDSSPYRLTTADVELAGEHNRIREAVGGKPVMVVAGSDHITGIQGLANNTISIETYNPLFHGQPMNPGQVALTRLIGERPLGAADPTVVVRW